MPSGGSYFLLCVTPILLVGVYWFFKGFRVYREYRVLADTPETPIRSIPMGLVEMHGKAKLAPDQLVPSPVTQTSCLFYKVDIERWIESKDKDGGRWSFFATDADGPSFYLEDASGKVLVDANHAEYDLLLTGQRETHNTVMAAIFLKFGGRATPGDLEAYVSRVAARHHASLSDSIKHLSLTAALGPSCGRFRLTEYCILPEHWYDVTGTCVENPKPKDEHDRNMIVKGQNEPTFLISWRGEKEVKSHLRKRAMKYIFGGGAIVLGCLGVLLALNGWLGDI